MWVRVLKGRFVVTFSQTQKYIWLHKCLRRKMKDHHPSQMRRQFCSELLAVPENDGSPSKKWTLSDGQVILGNNTMTDAGTERRYQKRKKMELHFNTLQHSPMTAECSSELQLPSLLAAWTACVCVCVAKASCFSFRRPCFQIRAAAHVKWGYSVASSRDLELKNKCVFVGKKPSYRSFHFPCLVTSHCKMLTYNMCLLPSPC